MSFSYPDRTVEIQSLHARVAEMEADAKRREDLIQDNRERIQGLKTRVTELETERNALVETINTMNEENAQLAHRLWCLENPE